MSDFSNYIRVAIQGLPENTPLARASAYEKVRKVIRRQLEARSAGEVEVNQTLEDLENAILDLEAEQMMVPAPAAKPAAAEPPRPAPAFDAESNVTPIVRKTADQGAREPAPSPKTADVAPAGAAAAGPEKRSEPKAVPRYADGPANGPVAPAQFPAQRTVAAAAPAERALKVEPDDRDPLEEFQSALTAELQLPITPEEQADARPTPQADADRELHDEPAPSEPFAADDLASLAVTALEPRDVPAETGFDVRILLRKAVDNEDMRDPATREIIYRRARNALIKYLKSLSPQPDFDTVHAHIERLNAAIREVEAEQAEKSLGNDNADTGPSTDELMSELEDIWSADFEQPAAGAAAPEPRRREPPRPDPGALERTIAEEVDEAVQELADAEFERKAPARAPEAETPAARSIDDEVEEAVQDLIAADSARHQIARNRPPKNTSRHRARPVAAEPDEDTFEAGAASATEEFDRWATEDNFELPDDMFDAEFGGGDTAAAPVAARQPHAAQERPRRRGGFGRILAILLVLIVAGVVAAAVAFPDLTSRYAAKAQTTGTWVLEFVAGLAGEPARPPQEDATEIAAAGETVPPEAGAPAEQAEAPAAEDAAAPAEETAMAPAPDESADQPATDTAVAPIDGERAFLFARSGGQPVVNGNVAWSVIESSPRPGAPAEPAIRGEVAIPADGLRATMTLRRNLDETLPATHLIELVFVPANGVGGSEIASLEGISMVQSAQDRSEPLFGSVVKIADNIFLFALADVPAARRQNDTLLSDPDLIEIQFVYYSGRQSTLRLVTGATGGTVFATAMEAWTGETDAPAATPAPAAETAQPEPVAAPEPAAAPRDVTPEPVAETAEPTTASEEESPAETVPGRPVIPDVVPIPPDRPPFNG